MNELLTAREVAEVLGESVSTITRLAQTGDLKTAAKAPGLRGARLFRRADVERLAAKRQKADAA